MHGILILVLQRFFYFAVVIGLMVLIHEFGHYAVAKLLGVRVEQFAIGFGKRLIGFRRGDTDYRINALPLGGYVKMSGENPMDEKRLLARLPISRRTLGNWKAKGILPYVKIGRRCLYDWASVKNALMRRQRGGRP